MAPNYLFRYNITKDDVTPDIELLARSFITGTFSKFTAKEQETLIDEMVQRSQGSFLWIDSVKKRMKPNIKIGKLVTDMRNIPIDLQEKYKEDLDKIVKNDPHTARSILSWVLLAKEPITLWEICQILAVQIDHAQLAVEHDSFPEPLDDEWIDDNILPFCGDLIIKQDNPTVVQDKWLGSATLSPLHPSVSDYLLPLLTSEHAANRHQRLFLEAEGEPSAHLHIAKICFAWLINNDIESELTVERPLPSAHRLKDYALNYWHVHLGESSDYDKFPLQLLLDFFHRDNPQFLDWATYFEGKNTEERNSDIVIGTPLHYAVLLGLKNIIDAIVTADPSQINVPGGLHGSALMAALSAKNLACFEQLLQNGADPDLQTESGCAFIMAVRLRAEQYLDLLLRYHANPKIEDGKKANALHALASKQEKAGNDLRIFKMLLDKGLDLNARNSDGETPLILAAANGHVEIVKAILSYESVDLDAVSHENRSAIYEASRFNQPVVFEILLKAGADFTTRRRTGIVPFSIACHNGYLPIVKLLATKVNDTGHIDTADDFDESPIFLASYQGHTDVVKLLLENNADYKSHYGVGFTSLNAACANGHTDVVQLLIELPDIQVNDKVSDTATIEVPQWSTYYKPDDGGSTSLILAAKRGHERIVEILMKVETIDILATDAKGNTALHHAVAGGFSVIIKDLMSRISPEDLPRHNKNNLLYHAIQNGQRDVTEMLLEKDFDINISKRNKAHAIEKLVRTGQCEILKLLATRWKDSFNAFWEHPSTNRLFDLAYFSDDGNTTDLMLRMYTANRPSNEPDPTDWTPLGYAAMHNQEQPAIDLLTSLKTHSNIANINHYNGDEHPSLLLAVRAGKSDFAQQLLDLGADPVLRIKGRNENILHQAIKSTKFELLEMLLGHLREIGRLDVMNFVDARGFTSIHQAVYDNSPVILKLLLEWGGDATCNTIAGTPLYLAAARGFQEVVTILLSHLKDTNNIQIMAQESKVDGERVTPLFGAVNGGHFEVTRALLEHGSEHGIDLLRTRYELRRSPILNVAAEEGYWQIAELIYTKEPSLCSLTNVTGQTPLTRAATFGDIRMVRLLLNQPNEAYQIIDHNGRNGLHYAAAHGHPRVVQILLQYDMSLLNTRDLYGATALSLSARWCQKEVVELLLRMPDIDCDLKDDFDKDAVSWMITSGLVEAEAETETNKSDQLTHYFSQFKGPSLIERSGVLCDVCYLPINASNEGWHCKLCCNGLFDICQRCRDGGGHCHDREHELNSVGKDINDFDAYKKAFRRRATEDLTGGNNQIQEIEDHENAGESNKDDAEGNEDKEADENNITKTPSRSDSDFDFNI